MKNHHHILSEVDIAARTAVCSQCAAVVRLASRGKGKFRCANKVAERQRSKYRYKFPQKTHCEACLFKARHSSQLEIHHKDGNHKNNERSNLVLICANCHKLAHYAPELLELDNG